MTTHTYETAEETPSVTKSLLSTTHSALYALTEDMDLADHQETVERFEQTLSLVEDVVVPLQGMKPTTFAINLARSVKALANQRRTLERMQAQHDQQCLSLLSTMAGLNEHGEITHD